MWPEVLPDGSVLFTVLSVSGKTADARLEILDPTGRIRTPVAEGVSNAHYARGHLIFADDEGGLFVQPFDLATRRTTGPRRAALRGARVGFWGGGVGYAISATGTLVYATGTELDNSILREFDAMGRELRVLGEPRSIGFYPTISPDRKTLAMGVRTARNDDIRLLDLATGREERFTVDVAEDETPIWSSDSRRVAYRTNALGNRTLVHAKTVGSSDPPSLLVTLSSHVHLTSWSPDGEWIAIDDSNAGSVRLVNLVDTARSVTLEAPSSGGVFSPDGDWLAYQSDESGVDEVFVVPLAAIGSPQQVSAGGGSRARWGDTARELYFLQGAQVMRVRRESEDRVSWEAPVALFAHAGGSLNVGAGGRTFYLVTPNPKNVAPHLFVVQNWLGSVLGQGLATGAP
jgi:dipeptidyl aminopeptidase/acylaminoacyl peptidase